MTDCLETAPTTTLIGFDAHERGNGRERTFVLSEAPAALPMIGAGRTALGPLRSVNQLVQQAKAAAPCL